MSSSGWCEKLFRKDESRSERLQAQYLWREDTLTSVTRGRWKSVYYCLFIVRYFCVWKNDLALWLFALLEDFTKLSSLFWNHFLFLPTLLGPVSLRFIKQLNLSSHLESQNHWLVCLQLWFLNSSVEHPHFVKRRSVAIGNFASS